VIKSPYESFSKNPAGVVRSMNRPCFIKKKREYATLCSNLFFLLLTGCICIVGIGYTIADSVGISNNSKVINERPTNFPFTDAGLPPGFSYSEDPDIKAHPHFRSDGGGAGHNGTSVSSKASLQEREATDSQANAMALKLTWQRCLGGSDFDSPRSIQQSSDGGFLIGGFACSFDGDCIDNHGSEDFFVAKVEASGDIAWKKCFGGSLYEEAYKIISTSDGGCLVGGITPSNDGDVTGYHGEFDIWVVKLDGSGNLVWQKCLGGSSEDWFKFVTHTVDGGFLIVGYSYSNDGDVTGNHGDRDIWVVKLDSSGELIWQKCLGGSLDEAPTSTIQTADGGFLIGGYTYSDDGDVTGNHGQTDFWVVKLDGSGNLVWQKCLGGSYDETLTTAIQTADGGYLVAGVATSNNGNVSGNFGGGDIWAVKLDSSGELIWQKCLGGTLYETPYSLIQTTDGGFLIGGFTYSPDGDVTGYHGETDIWVVKLDGSGNLVWQKCLGGSYDEAPTSAIQTADGGFLIGGYTYSDDGDVTGNHGETDIWIVKLDPAGELKWQKCIGGSADESSKSIIQISDNQYVVCGGVSSSDGDIVGNHGDFDYWLGLINVNHQVTATSDSMTIAYPPGTRSYEEGTDAAYLAQAKPGADLVNVSVDGIQVGPVSNWTFSQISSDHTFATTGQLTPGQVHAFFTVNKTWGAVPLTVQFTNQSFGDPRSFLWNFGDGETSTEQDPIHTYTTPGTYSVTLQANNAWTGGVATLSHALTATAGIVPSPTPTPVPGEITAAFSADRTRDSAPMQVLFSDRSTGNPTSWVWNFGDGTFSASQNTTHIYSTKGTYSVSLTAQNSAYSGSIEKSGYITVT